MEEIKIGDTVLVYAVIKEIIYDEKGKHYKVVINNDGMNANRVDESFIIIDKK
jgi:hypothetical protein